jgi:sugar fermentation stimulation protein A
MQFERPLLRAKMLKRYKRFFADVELNGQVVTAHCPNTGSLKSCWEAGRAALISESTNPDRKLKFTLELTEAPTGAWVGVNTGWPNKLVKEAFETGVVSDWKAYSSIQMEVKISKETRLDGCFKKSDGSLCYFEVKNTTLAENGLALFPDAETTRGQKHLQELMKLKSEGHGAEILFVVQRGDCKAFSPAAEIDPVYALLLKEAFDMGVAVRALVVNMSESQLKITGETLPLQW